jgi:hypothetical protein
LSKLAECLKEKKQQQQRVVITARASSKNRILTDQGIDDTVASLSDYYRKGSRQNFVLGLSGLMLKNDIALESAKKIIEKLGLACNDEENKDRLASLYATYKKDKREVIGAQLLLEILQGQDLKAYAANEIVSDVIKIWNDSAAEQQVELSKEEKIEQIVIDIMEQNTCKTTRSDEQLLIYNASSGCYESGERFIRERLERLYPNLTKYWRNEVIEHVKLRTSIDNEQVDSDPNILNLKN